MKTSLQFRARSRSGLSLIELMVTLAIIAMVASLFIPQVQEILTGSKKSAAQGMQGELAGWYGKWTGLGGTHGTSNTADDQAQLAFNLMTKMVSTVGDNSTVGSGGTIVNGENTSMSLNPSAIRSQANRPFQLGTGTAVGAQSSGPYVVYDQFLIRFNAASDHSGVWTVDPAK